MEHCTHHLIALKTPPQIEPNHRTSTTISALGIAVTRPAGVDSGGGDMGAHVLPPLLSLEVSMSLHHFHAPSHPFKNPISVTAYQLFHIQNYNGWWLTKYSRAFMTPVIMHHNLF